jgi:hypothetical protein
MVRYTAPSTSVSASGSVASRNRSACGAAVDQMPGASSEKLPLKAGTMRDRPRRD